MNLCWCFSLLTDLVVFFFPLIIITFCWWFQAIGLEKKQLYQQWNSSLIGMRRRDEAHAAMQEALQ
jgi:hypothetical protein